MSVMRVLKTLNFSENTFFPIRRTLKCPLSVQPVAKAFAIFYPNKNMLQSTKLKEGLNVLIACGASMKCQHSKVILAAASFVLCANAQTSTIIKQDPLSVTIVIRPLVERILLKIICRFTRKLNSSVATFARGNMHKEVL